MRVPNRPRSANHLLRLGALALIMLLSSLPFTTHAQDGGQVQELTDRIDPGKFRFYLLPDLEEGQTLYVHATGISGNLDPVVGLIDTTQDFQSVFADYFAERDRLLALGGDPLLAIEAVRDRFLLVWDDYSGGGLAAAVEFPVPSYGDYRLIVTGTPSYLGDETFGRYRLLLGLDAPQVLSGEAEPTGDTIALPDEEASEDARGVEQLTGNLSEEKSATFIN